VGLVDAEDGLLAGALLAELGEGDAGAGHRLGVLDLAEGVEGDDEVGVEADGDAGAGELLEVAADGVDVDAAGRATELEVDRGGGAERVAGGKVRSSQRVWKPGASAVVVLMTGTQAKRAAAARPRAARPGRRRRGSAGSAGRTRRSGRASAGDAVGARAVGVHAARGREVEEVAGAGAGALGGDDGRVAGRRRFVGARWLGDRWRRRRACCPWGQVRRRRAGAAGQVAVGCPWGQVRRRAWRGRGGGAGWGEAASGEAASSAAQAPGMARARRWGRPWHGILLGRAARGFKP
jgi:hypothetical protein